MIVTKDDGKTIIASGLGNDFDASVEDKAEMAKFEAQKCEPWL